jgi:UDP-N-acetylglucosamine--N-acetylmuramyl-(pentapeptide) pyrophosphoryl-undecaprenol N-acetylglucosamine transferase
VPWHVIGFEDHMSYFYAASDLVVGRGGGMVAEILATGTPSVLVPGGFGSGGHQDANAEAAQRAGASVVLRETEIYRLPSLITELFQDPDRRQRMAEAAAALAKTDAADRIAAILMGRHG